MTGEWIVRLPTWLGDTIMAVPTVRALRRACADPVALWGSAPYAALLQEIGLAGTFIPYRRRQGPAGVSDVIRTVADVPRRRPAGVILLPNAFEAALLAGLAGIPTRIGYATDGRARLLTHPIAPPPESRRGHESNRFAELLQAIDVAAPHPSDADLQPSDLLIERARRLLPDRRPFFGIVAGSANAPAKRWPPTAYERLASIAARRWDATPLLLGSEADRPINEAVRDACEVETADLTGCDMPDLVAALLRCRLVVSNDTGAAHLAAALGRPTVVLFGPTDERRSAPAGAATATVSQACFRRPCMASVCPLDHRCMATLSPERRWSKPSLRCGTLMPRFGDLLMSTPSNLPALATLCPLVDRFREARLAVWGDIVADRFIYGSTTRISREAPALVVRKEDAEIRPGGAGNTMMNAAALGARVTALGYLGDDDTGNTLRQTLEAGGVGTEGLIRRDDASTPTKTRVMAGGLHTVRQQILRIDDDAPWPADAAAAERLERSLTACSDEVDALLLSDYGMGSVNGDSFAAVFSRWTERGAPVVADSRAALLSYRGASAATPNEEEVKDALGVDLESDDSGLERAGAELLERLGSATVLVTRGSRGMSLFEADGNIAHLPIHGTDQIADVTGAGDAVIATFTTALVVGATPLEAACLSNVAAGLAVMKRGTAAVPAAELRAALEGAT